MPLPIAPAPSTPITGFDTLLSSLETGRALGKKCLHAFTKIMAAAGFSLQSLFYVELRG
jgi:hypothetical protein